MSLKGHAGIEGTERLVGSSDPKCKASGKSKRTGDEIKSSVVLSHAWRFGALTAAPPRARTHGMKRQKQGWEAHRDHTHPVVAMAATTSLGCFTGFQLSPVSNRE